jgi:hypothetical protein
MMRAPILLITVCTIACNSPEAARERGGGAGADPGNRDPVVEMHQGAEPYHDTPCRMTDVECPEQKPSPAAKRASES